MTSFLFRRVYRAMLALFLGLATAHAHAEVLVPLNVDVSGLPPLGNQWREENPYRGNAAAVLVGQEAFEKTCARCHALAETGGIGPDLRALNRYCVKIADESLKIRCLKDQDVYFRDTALTGKVVVGVRHMPAWKGILTQEAIWAIRTYVESRSSLKK